MKQFILSICAFMCITAAASSPDRGSRYSLNPHCNDSWLFLEELIVLQPQRSVDQWFGKRGLSILAALGTSYLGYQGSQKLFGSSGKFAVPAAGATSIAAGGISYLVLQTYFLNRAERNQITMLMKLWTQLRDRIPHEVWPMLDTLYSAWLHDQEAYQNQLEDTLSYLKAEVFGHFPNRYKATSDSFFTSRNLSVQVRLNLYKVAKATYRTIKELFD